MGHKRCLDEMLSCTLLSTNFSQSAKNPTLARQAARCSITDTTEFQAEDAGALNMDLSLDLAVTSAVPTARDLGLKDSSSYGFQGSWRLVHIFPI